MDEITWPLVSIITINFNQSAVTADLLNSLKNISYPHYEVIVVDNGSEKDSVDSLIPLFPEDIFLKSHLNLGFAGGNNLGVKEARGDYLLFLNNDTEVDPGFLEPLVRRLESDTNIGMVSPKIRFHHTPDTIQYAGYTPMNPITLRQHLIGYREKDRGQYDVSRSTFSIHGAAMMVPRRIILEVGMMDEIYFLYYEEHDWAERVKHAGYIVYYEADSLVMHKESISTGIESPLKVFYINRNRLVFARRNCKGFRKVFAMTYLSFIAFPKALMSYFLKGRFDLALCVWKAYFWNFSRFSLTRNNFYMN